MKHLKRAVALFLFLLFLLPSVQAYAAQESTEAPANEGIEKNAVSRDKELDVVAAQRKSGYDEGLYKQIQDTYKAAKKRSRRRSFKGYCGAYVANQLVVLGINTSYLSANGKNTYDIYRKMDYTSGGYHVSAYSAKKYSLSEALKTIMEKDSSARNILVGFQRGTSKSGKKYGHVLLIHGIQNEKIYFSDSSARTVDDVKYKEGEPIVCSLTSFVDQYAKYKLDGVIHFQKTKNAAAAQDAKPPVAEEMSSTSSEKVLALG